jgi:hypothetical protein
MAPEKMSLEVDLDVPVNFPDLCGVCGEPADHINVEYPIFQEVEVFLREAESSEFDQASKGFSTLTGMVAGAILGGGLPGAIWGALGGALGGAKAGSHSESDVTSGVSKQTVQILKPKICPSCVKKVSAAIDSNPDFTGINFIFQIDQKEKSLVIQSDSKDFFEALSFNNPQADLSPAAKLVINSDKDTKPGRHKVNREFCSFCHHHIADNNLTLQHYFHKITNYTLFKKDWQYLTISASFPRCRPCANLHESGDKISKKGAIIGAVAGSVILPIVVSLTEKQSPDIWGVICVMFFGAIFGGGGVMWLMDYLQKLRNRNFYIRRPVDEFKSYGWSEGSKPAT